MDAGTHAMSRAIGDFELKNNINLDMRDQAISNEPELRRLPITSYGVCRAANLSLSCMN